jgi:hypothetical protein
MILAASGVLDGIARELGARVARGPRELLNISRAQEINRREFPSIVIT